MSTGKGQARPTRAMYEAMMVAFRQYPENWQKASELARVGTRRVKRAWLEGWPDLGMPPIRDIILREQQAARANLNRKATVREQAAEKVAFQAEEVRRQAELDAVKQRTEEGTLVRSTRRNALALNGVTAQLLRGAIKLAGDLELHMQTGKVKPAEAMALITRVSVAVRNGAESAKLAMQLERMLLGEPEGQADAEAIKGSRDPEAITTKIERAGKALERARERGTLRVIEGGVNAPERQVEDADAADAGE